jgi:transcriptional regulator with XRE-family HTH domain
LTVVEDDGIVVACDRRRVARVDPGHVAVGQCQRARWLVDTMPVGVRSSSSAVSNVAETLKLALTAVGSAAELARVLEVTPSHISRLRKGTAGISAELSLRLSRVIGRPALQGLRDDGHTVLAELLEPLAGIRHDKLTSLSPGLADDLAALTPDDIHHIQGLVASLAKGATRIRHRKR